MKISASIYSSKNQALPDLIRDLDDHSVDLLHVDCNDDPGVFDDIKKIRELTNLPIDLHIITPNPEKYYPLLEECPVEYVTFQYEPLSEPIEVPKSISAKLGLAITSDTDIEVFDAYADRFSFILFMATVPGQSGGKFNKENFRKIRRFRNQHPSIHIHVDGGVNAEVSFILRNMAVYSAVVGSYLFSEPLGAALLKLKTHETDSHFLVKDFMREPDELPILQPHQHTLKEVLETIERFKMAFTLLVDEAGKLKGLISNADVRRGMLSHIEDLNKIEVSELINTTPIVIDEDKTVMELLRFVKAQNVPINYLPVVNADKQLTGAISFTNLIKGEL
jgi:pentose-5-phosphate-3-epimerase